MKSLLVMLFVGVLTLMLVGCGEDEPPPAPETGSITVTALHEGQSVDSAFVAVSLSSDTAAELVAAGTTMDGECVISGLASGDYTVTVSKSVGGQLIYGAQSNVQVSAGATATQTVQVDQQIADLYPLAVGNTWTYTDGVDSNFIGGVVSGKEIHGVLTYRVGPENEPDVPPYPFYVQRGVAASYCYGWITQSGSDYFLNTPVIWIDFSASEGDCWTIPEWGTTVCCLATGVEISVPAGSYSDCYYLRFTGGKMTGDYWFAPGVGPVRMVGDYTLELISYKLY